MSIQPLISSSPSESTRTLLFGIWAHLSRRRRIQFCSLVVVMLASGGAEIVSLGAVLPFLAVLSDPERLWQQHFVHSLALQYGFTQASQLLLPATLLFASAAVLSALIRLFNLWVNGRMAAEIGSDLSFECYRRTLYQPYDLHVQRNSALVITGITSKISQTVAALNAILELLTSLVVALGLLIGLILIDAQVAVGAATLFSSAYGILAITSRRELRINGQKIAFASTLQLKALQEGLGAIRDVLLDSNQSTYLQIYRNADRPQRQLAAQNTFLGAFPRYVIEALGIVAIALLGGLLVIHQRSGVSVIPLLGALALGAQRLLPALQQIYRGWSLLTSYNAAIKDVLVMLNQSLPAQIDSVDPIPFSSAIRFHNVFFRYSPEEPNVLNGLTLNICCGERIGLIGSTGSGKSTTADLLMGLLAPTHGQIFIDGQDLHDLNRPDRLLAWRKTIAHVPQSIYLADSSIAENIAFGVPRDSIDMERVERAACQAQISSFIQSMSDGYATFVGERGIRLSGGQRQRIGIARALYKQASVIILDEATSALDVHTENSVMEAVEGFSRNLTLVMIAHRLSTVQRCDRVIRLDRGMILADGPPHQVLSDHSQS